MVDANMLNRQLLAVHTHSHMPEHATACVCQALNCCTKLGPSSRVCYARRKASTCSLVCRTHCTTNVHHSAVPPQQHNGQNAAVCRTLLLLLGACVAMACLNIELACWRVTGAHHHVSKSKSSTIQRSGVCYTKCVHLECVQLCATHFKLEPGR
jgi:hypothetical protein